MISIITPSYNQGRFVERAIQSVLSQKVPEMEFMVCDGGSTDGTVEILRSHEREIRWVSEKDLGQADAVNKGLRKTKAPVIGWLNSDDVYYPGALPAVLAFFASHPGADVVYGDAYHIDEEDGVLEPYYTEDWDYERLKEVCFICQPALFFRRRIVERFGPLDVHLRYCLDYEYWLRVGKTIPFVHLRQVLAGSRLHRETKTLRDREKVHFEINGMLKRTLGKTPTRWIYNYAFARIDSRGFDRSRPGDYVWPLIGGLLYAYWHWRRFIPPSAWKTALLWLLQAYGNGRQGLDIPHRRRVC